MQSPEESSSPSVCPRDELLMGGPDAGVDDVDGGSFPRAIGVKCPIPVRTHATLNRCPDRRRRVCISMTWRQVQMHTGESNGQDLTIDCHSGRQPTTSCSSQALASRLQQHYRLWSGLGRQAIPALLHITLTLTLTLMVHGLGGTLQWERTCIAD